MKKYTENYFLTTVGADLEQFLNDGDVFEFYNSVANKDKSLLPLAMFFATKVEITNMPGTLDLDMDKLQGFEEGVKQDMEKHKETISNLANVVAFNDPRVSDLFKQE